MLRNPNLVPLSHDHQHVLALCVLVDRALAADSGEETVKTQAGKILDTFHAEMVDHFRFEEQVLFPALAGFAELEPVVSELTGEHRSAESIVRTITESPGKPAPIQEFTALLRAHIRKEENVLFERGQQLLPPEELQRIGDVLRERPNPSQCRL